MGEGVGSPAVAQGRGFCLDDRDEKETLAAYVDGNLLTRDHETLRCLQVVE